MNVCKTFVVSAKKCKKTKHLYIVQQQRAFDDQILHNTEQNAWLGELLLY